MNYLVFGDVHGNLPALENLLKNEKGVDAYINLGDVVNYGPWSNECVELISSLDNCINIKGNHEKYFIEKECNIENDIVQAFFRCNISSFSQNEKIKMYLKNYKLNGFNFIHNISGHKYIFNDTIVKIKDNTVLAHSHQQYIRYFNNHLIINPGSVGQNRDIINMSNYIIWNTETGEFKLKHLLFSIEILINELKIRKFPNSCIDYYKSKKILI